MITAIPMSEGRVASHFSKADSLLFIDAQGVEISRHANPALATHCAGKLRLLELLSAEGAQRVVVRNIGEQMLGRLLASGLSVWQTRCGRRLPGELVMVDANTLLPLTEASQGRQSLNHEAKAKSGGCGCGEHGALACSKDKGESQGCCRDAHEHSSAPHAQRGHGRCCHS